jgi:uncharacterized protein
MKTLALTAISLYQVFFSVILKQLFGITAFCRFSPTCSLYTKRMIIKHGVIKGGGMGIRRILSCNPFNRYATV